MSSPFQPALLEQSRSTSDMEFCLVSIVILHDSKSILNVSSILSAFSIVPVILYGAPLVSGDNVKLNISLTKSYGESL